MADKAVRPNIFSYRIGRLSYWINVAALIVLGVALSLVLPSSSGGAAVVWFLIYAWRLHDFGRSAWLAAAVLAATLIVGVGGIFLAVSMPAASVDSVSTWAITIAIVMQMAFTIWLGTVRGDEGPNRFGARSTYKIGRFTI